MVSNAFEKSRNKPETNLPSFHADTSLSIMPYMSNDVLIQTVFLIHLEMTPIVYDTLSIDFFKWRTVLTLACNY